MSLVLTPADARTVATTGAPSGFVNPGGMNTLRSALDGNAAEFARWRRDPMTRMIVAALQDAIVHPPPAVNSDNALLQYGVTQGLSLAFHLCVDPSAVWPGVFGKNTNAGEVLDVPSMDFETSIDEAIK